MKTIYTKNFFAKIQSGSQRSAEEIVPLVLEYVQPHSVVDMGCGMGTWLSVFKKHGVAEVLGVDGDYADREALQISAQEFLPFDLRQPFRAERTFDLVLALEVAEHLPATCAETFVASLVRLGPVILFSAAVPFQGGTNHLNAQWPDYWMQKFSRYNYAPIDCLRRRLWQNTKVEWWYAQNLMFYAEKKFLTRHAPLQKEADNTATEQLALAHPRLVDPRYMSPRRLLEAVPRALWHGMKRRMARAR